MIKCLLTLLMCIIAKLQSEIFAKADCEVPSITTASGSLVDNQETFCPGELIFEENFDKLDLEKWQHENTLAGGGNWEFQWYTNNRSNSFVKDGILHIRPTLTADVLGEAFLSSGTLSIYGGSPADECTNPSFWGCERKGTPTHIVNPIRSARIRTVYSFNFKYGILKTRVKLPAGDWLWPAVWLVPKNNAYGSWPSSGEIDIVESRGNTDFVKDGVNIGPEQISATLHYGIFRSDDAYNTSSFKKNSPPGQGYDKDFHEYEFHWTPESMKFLLDGEELGNVTVGEGFWKLGNFSDNYDNPWEGGGLSAPFDQEFHIIINLAVGGLSFFPDDAESPRMKPWKNYSPNAAKEFWDARDEWLPTWNLNDKNSTSSSLLVDYIRVYAL